VFLLFVVCVVWFMVTLGTSLHFNSIAHSLTVESFLRGGLGVIHASCIATGAG